MIFPKINGAIRPDRLKDEKDEKYHINMARWSLSRCDNSWLYWNMYKYYINFNFYTNRQWIFNEDIQPFLNDDVSMRNRVRWEYNVIEGYVNRVSGQAVKIEYNRRAYNATPQADKHKTQEWSKVALMWNIAQRMPLLKEKLTIQYNLQDTLEATKQLFDEKWIDVTDVAINNLIRNTENRNNFKSLQTQLSIDKTLAGIAVLRDDIINNKQIFERVNPSLFFYDVAAQRSDLQDGAYMGEIETPTAGEIIEISGCDSETATLIYASQDYYSSNVVNQFNNTFGVPQGRFPVYRIYFRDIDKYEFGWVASEIGMPLIQRITEENKANVIPLNSLSESMKRQLSGNNNADIKSDGTIKKFDETIRYCRLLPKEFLRGKVDVVLGWGEVDCPNTNQQDPFQKMYPYHIDTYIYQLGQLYTPTDSLVKPQRLLNRLISIMESTMNQIRGSGVIIDSNGLPDAAGNDAQGMVQEQINQGKTVFLDGTRLPGGITQSVVPYSSAPQLQAVSGMMSIVNGIQTMAQNNSGMNRDLTGTGAGTSVGVMQNNISQGNLMFETFFNGIDTLFRSVYYSIANRGRKYYAKNEMELFEMYGARESNYIRFTKDMMLHDMNIELKRVDTSFINIEQNNMLLVQLRNLGLLGDTQVAELWGRAEGDEIAYSMRDYNVQKLEQMRNTPPQKTDLDKRLETELTKKQMDVQQQQNTDASKMQLAEYEWNRRDAKDIRSGTNKLIVTKMKDESKQNQQGEDSSY